ELFLAELGRDVVLDSIFVCERRRALPLAAVEGQIDRQYKFREQAHWRRRDSSGVDRRENGRPRLLSLRLRHLSNSAEGSFFAAPPVPILEFPFSVPFEQVSFLKPFTHEVSFSVYGLFFGDSIILAIAALEFFVTWLRPH